MSVGGSGRGARGVVRVTKPLAEGIWARSTWWRGQVQEEQVVQVVQVSVGFEIKGYFCHS